MEGRRRRLASWIFTSVASAYLLAAGVAFPVGAHQGAKLSLPPPRTGPLTVSETIPVRATTLWRHNLQVMSSLAIGNACTGGVYGLVGTAYNGYNVGVMAAVVRRRDPHLLSGFAAFAFLELVALAVAAAAGGLVPWAALGFVRISWGKLALTWVCCGALFGVAAVIEAVVGARIS